MSLAERFASRVKKGVRCWVWTGARNGGGYGRFYVGGYRYVAAHRLSFALSNGPIPDELCVLHRCDNPPCVRPSHLFLGTLAQNNTDRDRKGRTNNEPGRLASLRSRADRTQCARGHPFTPANTYRNARGHRECRTCRYDAVKRWRNRSA